MNAKSLITAIALSAGFAGAAFAEGPIQSNDVFVGSKTRAEVQAELSAYKQAGVNPWSTSYNPLKGFRSAVTRDAVVADYIASRDQVRAVTGEDSGSAYFAQERSLVAPATLAGTPARAQ
jgi:hypothetical protein